jgi:hypothetical protein
MVTKRRPSVRPSSARSSSSVGRPSVGRSSVAGRSSMPTVPWWRRHVRWLMVGAVVVVAAVVATIVGVSVGGSGHHGTAASGPRPITSAEADRLAIMRFLNYEKTGVGFQTEVATSNGGLNLAGSVDYHQDLGYAAVSGTGVAGNSAIQWNASTVALWPGVGDGKTPPATVPASPPQTRALDPTTQTVDVVLEALLDLGQGRPDNAQLLQQDGATWIRSDTVGPTAVDVIDGPRAEQSTVASGSPSSVSSVSSASSVPASSSASSSASAVQYWIDAQGHLLRLELTLGGSAVPTVIDINQAAFRTFTRTSALSA